MNQFEHIRKYKNKHVWRNRLCLYGNQLMRIVGTTDTGDIILRNQVICHPQDPELRIIQERDLLSAVQILSSAIRDVIKTQPYEWIWDDVDDEEQVEHIMKHWVDELELNIKMLTKASE